MTNNGLKVMLDSKNIIINSSLTSISNNHLIMDLEFLGKHLYLLSDYGFFQYNFDTDVVMKISDKVYRKITSDSSSNLFLATKNKIFKFNNNQESLIRRLKNVKDVSYCNNFLWINNFKYVTIIDLRTNEVVEYTDVDGLLSQNINNLDCDKDWVWFSTVDGLILYNWAKYHNVK